MESEAQKFIVILEQDENWVYSVHCPALPGCSSQGCDRDGALEMIVDAIQGVLEVIQERIPEKPDLVFVSEETPQMLSAEVCEILEFRAELGLPLVIEFAEVTVPSPVAV